MIYLERSIVRYDRWEKGFGIFVCFTLDITHVGAGLPLNTIHTFYDINWWVSGFLAAGLWGYETAQERVWSHSVRASGLG